MRGSEPSTWRVFVGVVLLCVAFFKICGLLMLLFVQHDQSGAYVARQIAWIIGLVSIAIYLRGRPTRDDEP